MDKFKVYKNLRKELAAAYQDELLRVRKLLKGGVVAISGAQCGIHCGASDSLVEHGEAGKIFRDEISDTLQLTLERYERNLCREISDLGLSLPKSTESDLGLSLTKSTESENVDTVETLSSANGISAFAQWAENE